MVHHHYDNDSLTNAGAIFEKHPVEGEPALFRGSVVVYAGESEAEVRKIIENDIYATSGVWDLEKTQIIPVGLIYRRIIGLFNNTKLTSPAF
jgi:uncharacterized protein YciI